MTDTTTKPTVIKVVSSKRSLDDITTFTEEELQITLETISQNFVITERQSVYDFIKLISIINELQDKRPVGTSFHINGPQKKFTKNNEMIEIFMRQLFYSNAVYPITDEASETGKTGKTGKTGETNDVNIRVRAGIQKPILRSNSGVDKYISASVAAEQAMQIKGIVIDPNKDGNIILEILASGFSDFTKNNRKTNLTSFNLAVLSVLFTKKQLYLDGYARIENKVNENAYKYSLDLIKDLSYQLSNYISYHLDVGGILANNAMVRKSADTNLSSLIVTKKAKGIQSSQPIKTFMSRLAEAFPNIVSDENTFTFSLSALADIVRVNANKIYYNVLTRGIDSEVQRFLDRAIIATDTNLKLSKLNQEILQNIAKTKQYLMIIEDKFGGSKINELGYSDQLNIPDNPEVVINKLNKRERELVEIEYDNKVKAWDAMIGNKCPHVNLAIKLRRASNINDAMKILKQLSVYFNKTKGWIYCKNCKFRVICSHVEAVIMMNYKNLPYDTIRTRLLPFSVQYSFKNADVSRLVYAYYCKHCGEKLAEMFGENKLVDITGAIGSLDDYIKTIIWTESSKAADYVKFPTQVDPRIFATTAADILHPIFLTVEANLLKKQRKSAKISEDDEIDPRTLLYIIIFIYAYILNLIRLTHTSKEKISFEGVNAGSKLSKYAEVILSTILRTQQKLISTIEDITPEFIAERFREAYRIISTEKTTQDIPIGQDDAQSMINNFIELNPIYKFATTAAIISGYLPIRSSNKPDEIRKEFETVLGRSLPDVLNDRAVNSDSKLVHMLLGIKKRKSATGRRVTVEYPIGSDPLYIYSSPEVNFLSNMFQIKTPTGDLLNKTENLSDNMPAIVDIMHLVVGGAVNKFANKFANKTANKSANKTTNKSANKFANKFANKSTTSKEYLNTKINHFVDILKPAGELYLKSYHLFVEYATKVTDISSMEKYQKKLKHLKRQESSYLIYRSAASVKPNKYFKFNQTRRYDVRKTQQEITYLYDEQGQPHTWAKNTAQNIYIYSDDSQLTRKEINEGIKANKRLIHDHKIKDIKCGICGILLSEVDKLNKQVTIKSIHALEEFTTFFSFYTSRCPEEGLHEFTKGECKKCGMSKELIFNYKLQKNANIARKYFNNYIETYYKQKIISTTNTFDEDNEIIYPKETFAKSWKRDYTYLVKAASLINAQPIVLESIGATEQRFYEDVLNGKDEPSPLKELDDIRLSTADSALRVFITYYNQLRFVYRFAKPNFNIDSILKSADVPKHEYEQLVNLLPDVFSDYNENRKSMTLYRSANDIYEFIIETIAKAAIQINSVKSDKHWLKKLCNEFVTFILNRIVRTEKLLAKNGPFNFKIFGEDRMDVDNFDDAEFEVSGEDVIEEIEQNSGEDGVEDAFSLEGVDIDEDDPNLE